MLAPCSRARATDSGVGCHCLLWCFGFSGVWVLVAFGVMGALGYLQEQRLKQTGGGYGGGGGSGSAGQSLSSPYVDRKRCQVASFPLPNRNSPRTLPSTTHLPALAEQAPTNSNTCRNIKLNHGPSTLFLGLRIKANLTPDLVRSLPLRRSPPRYPPAHLHMCLRPPGRAGDG